jgi:pilus assembly protein CpaC
MSSIVFVRMKRLLVSALLASNALLAAHAFAQMPAGEIGRNGASNMSGHEHFELNIGEQKVIDADGVRSFSEGTKGVIDIRLTKENDRFVVVGLRAGSTTLLFIMMDGSQVHYDVQVTDPNAKPAPSKDTVQSRDNIRLDLYFVQLSNNYTHSLGVGWPTSLSATTALNLSFDLQGGALSGATAVISGSVLPRLDFAQSDGWAKITRKAAVITANGTQASFSGGGEVNIAISGGFGGTLKQISYGSQIGVRPRYDKETGR